MMIITIYYGVKHGGLGESLVHHAGASAKWHDQVTVLGGRRGSLRGRTGSPGCKFTRNTGGWGVIVKQTLISSPSDYLYPRGQRPQAALRLPASNGIFQETHLCSRFRFIFTPKRRPSHQALRVRVTCSPVPDDSMRN